MNEFNRPVVRITKELTTSVVGGGQRRPIKQAGSNNMGLHLSDVVSTPDSTTFVFGDVILTCQRFTSLV